MNGKSLLLMKLQLKNNSMEIPIQIIEGDSLKIEVSLNIYNKEIVVAALYELTSVCYIHQKEIDQKTIQVSFEPKSDIDINLIAKKFCNNLIDQQVRYNTNQQFGRIRDMIVEEAFKPISNK